jgi:SAM-dependent methyltransferase
VVRKPTTRVKWQPGFHVAAGHGVDFPAYEGYLGRWSRRFVPALVEAADVATGHRVLDVATGPGEAAELALDRVGRSGLVIGVDVASPMLDVSSTRFDGQRFAAVAADGHALPFSDGVFDSVICQLGLMFFTDPGRGLQEFRRVLRSRGRAAACVISSPRRAPQWGILAETLSEYLPDERDVLYLSFALADPGRLEALFASAGFCDIRIGLETREARFESFTDYWAVFEAGAGSLPQAYRALPEPLRHAVQDRVKARLSEYESARGVVMGLEMIIAAGRA